LGSGKLQVASLMNDECKMLNVKGGMRNWTLTSDSWPQPSAFQSTKCVGICRRVIMSRFEG